MQLKMNYSHFYELIVDIQRKELASNWLNICHRETIAATFYDYLTTSLSKHR